MDNEKKKGKANKHKNVIGLCSNQGKEVRHRIRYYFTILNLQKLKGQTMSSIIKDDGIKEPLLHVDACAFVNNHTEEELGNICQRCRSSVIQKVQSSKLSQ